MKPICLACALLMMAVKPIFAGPPVSSAPPVAPAPITIQPAAQKCVVEILSGDKTVATIDLGQAHIAYKFDTASSKRLPNGNTLILADHVVMTATEPGLSPINITADKVRITLEPAEVVK